MSGSHFEGNKIVAAVLVALLLGHSASLIADHLVAPKPLEKHAYAPVDIAAAPTADEGDVNARLATAWLRMAPIWWARKCGGWLAGINVTSPILPIPRRFRG